MSTTPEFWEQRYRARRMPWDMHGVPPALLEFLRRQPATGRVLIPGCGSGYEVKAFADCGWQPVAIDFSPAAVERARDLLGPLAPAVVLGDFFTADLGASFDLVYERTFLCSLPPERWPAYAERIARLLAPRGRLAGFFVYGEEPEPPPYLLRDAPTASALFCPAFEQIEDHPIPAAQSLPLYEAKERWQVWRKRRDVLGKNCEPRNQRR